jgi:hypothetical protein
MPNHILDLRGVLWRAFSDLNVDQMSEGLIYPQRTWDTILCGSAVRATVDMCGHQAQFGWYSSLEVTMSVIFPVNSMAFVRLQNVHV